MNKEQTIFSQLMELVPKHEFNRCVKRYCKNINPRKFSFWDQFLAMAFAQLTFRESLRDIEECFSALHSKTYHMGIRGRVIRSTLAYSNETRDWRVWSDFAQVLIERARKLYAKEKLEFEFDNVAYALDSTTITLCLTLFPWARFGSKKKGIKLHTQLDLRGNIPSFVHISQAKVNDVNFLDELILEAGALYVMDRGYFDFARLFQFVLIGAFFVTRLKKNVAYRRIKIFSRASTGAIRMDAAIVPLSKTARKNYPERIRLIEFYDEERKKKLVFITNNFALPAQTIADIYKARWQIELFFKWIKQHLRIKAFFGTSENAVKTQIWIAISVYLLVAILKKELRLKKSLHSILQVLSICSIDKIPILSALNHTNKDSQPLANSNQLNLFDIRIGH